VAFTEEQKRWFHLRDQERCQFPIWNPKTKRWRICGSLEKLQVHHLQPQRFTLATQGKTIDTATNGLLICLTHHKKIHPDLEVAFNLYHLNKESFKEMSVSRDQRVNQGEIYWNSQWDLMMVRISEKNTFTFKKRGGYRYPQCRKIVRPKRKK